MVNTFNAKMILLATGGVGQVYLHTTNPEIATGDGIAMAYRAGALIADMEFIQFHPTALYTPKSTGPSFLISEAVRGEGAILLNTRGERFMERVHPLKDLAPRDIVARVIDMELKKYGVTNVYLDITSKSKKFLMRRFPNIYARCLEEGIDISKEPIPGRARGPLPLRRRGQRHERQNVDRKPLRLRRIVLHRRARRQPAGQQLPARGDRLLPPGLSAGRGAPRRLQPEDAPCRAFPNWNKEGTFDLEEWVLVQHDIEDVKRLMWDYVGIVRSDKRLQKAHKRILMLAEDIHDYYKKSTISSRIVELRNLATVAKLIIRSAMARRDSIGLHYNSDHPATSARKMNVVLQAEHEPKLVRLGRD